MLVTCQVSSGRSSGDAYTHWIFVLFIRNKFNTHTVKKEGTLNVDVAPGAGFRYHNCRIYCTLLLADFSAI